MIDSNKPLWDDERIDKAAMDDWNYSTSYEAARSALRKMRYDYEAALTELRAQLAEAQLAAASGEWEDVPIHEIWNPDRIPPGHWEVRAQRRNVDASAGESGNVD